MKINARTVLKITRLYGLADDNTPVKSLKKLQTVDGNFYVRADFVLEKNKYMLFYGSSVDDDFLTELWPDHPNEVEVLTSPLDTSEKITPFQGKFVALCRLPATTKRLDVFLSSDFDSSISRSLWQKYIKSGAVKVNGRTVLSPKQEVNDTDDIAVDFPKPKIDSHDIEIIYEDQDILVINKPSGLLTHAKGGIPDEQTVADSLRHKTSFAANSNRPGVIHRLDRDTSGLLVLAKNEATAKDLQHQFANRLIKKTYIAVVNGAPKHPAAQIDLPIARNPSKPSTFRVDPNGKSAQTFYKVLSSDGDTSLVELNPKTGRTHQLRVHMKYLNTPIVGDIVYGEAADRLMLHAWKLEFRLPSGEPKSFTAPLPKEFLTDFPEVNL